MGKHVIYNCNVKISVNLSQRKIHMIRLRGASYAETLRRKTSLGCARTLIMRFWIKTLLLCLTLFVGQRELSAQNVADDDSLMKQLSLPDLLVRARRSLETSILRRKACFIGGEYVMLRRPYLTLAMSPVPLLKPTNLPKPYLRRNEISTSRELNES